jgi:hypothetical protein
MAPPLPSQCQSGVSKWKRITGDDEMTSATSSDNSKTVNPPTPSSTKTGQVSSSHSLPNLPPKQTPPLSSSKLSDDLKNVVQANASSSTGSIAKPPAKSSPSNTSDDKKGDVDVIESLTKKAKNGELATSSSKNSAPAKVQFEAASALKASTSKRMWFHQPNWVIISYF